MPPIRTMVLGALAVGAQAFSSTPTTTTGGLPPCGTLDDNGLNCQGLKNPTDICYGDNFGWYSAYMPEDYESETYYGEMKCDCMTFCCSDSLAVFTNGECDTTMVGR